MDEILKCIGCGTPLQSEDKSVFGYTSGHNLLRDDVIYQCYFRLKDYNEVQDIGMDGEDFLDLLDELSDRQRITVNVINVFDFGGSSTNALKRVVRNEKTILAANKSDLLPRQINQRHVEEQLKRTARKYGLKVEEVVLISTHKGWGTDALLESISRFRNHQDAYIVGTTNVDKSTLINKLIEQSVGEKDVVITSKLPGTTLDIVDTPLDKNAFMYDAPGIIQMHQMTHYVTEEELRVIIPGNEVKQRVFQSNEGQTLLFGGLAGIDHVSGGKRPLAYYFSNDLNIHRTKTEKTNDL